LRACGQQVIPRTKALKARIHNHTLLGVAPISLKSQILTKLKGYCIVTGNSLGKSTAMGSFSAGLSEA
jgi:hypothetical protein